MKRRHLAWAAGAVVLAAAGCFPTPADRVKNHSPPSGRSYATGRPWATFRAAPATAFRAAPARGTTR